MFLGFYNCKSFDKYINKVEEDSPHKFAEYKELMKYLREESQLKGAGVFMGLKLYSTFKCEVHSYCF